MQFFWLYMDELIGKGLGIWMILKLLFFMSATLVPMALPLGILLASIMSFGDMGEHFELVAIKASGISLLRFMQPLLICILGLGGLAFLFNNNVIPVANLKALSLLYDLRNSKPALNIRVGQFNRDIDNYTIRIGSKDPDGKTIRDVIIYDHTSGFGNDKVVVAAKGEMIPVPGSQFLVFRLQDGWRYDDEAVQGGSKSYQQTRMHFKRWDKHFDLSGFKLNRTDENLFKGAYQMMNVRQLNQGIDSLRRHQQRLSGNISSYLTPYITPVAKSAERRILDSLIDISGQGRLTAYPKVFIEYVPDSLKEAVAQAASAHVRNAKGLVSMVATDSQINDENERKYFIEWHRKFTLSFACVLLFLIGAPLGAIIRKGGIGMPLVLAVVFFIVFHVLSIVGEKLAKSAALATWQGMWLSTAALLPIAFLLINAARKDSSVLSKERYLRLLAAVAKLTKKR